MSKTFEEAYLSLLADVRENGEIRADRTGTGTRAIFGRSITGSLDRFPLLTTKRMSLQSILGELLWFIEGSGDERRLAEITHGTRDQTRRTIWSPNAEGTSGSSFIPRYKGDLGRIYGVQWRDWRSTRVTGYDDILQADGSETTFFGATVKTRGIDQLAEVIHKLKTNPTDRRIIMTAWNPGELDQMQLPPCHMFVQFFMSNNRKLSTIVYMRSVDVFLGLPYNIASYAALTHVIAKVVGCGVGNLTLNLGDTHIYNNHLEQVAIQLDRAPMLAPTLQIKDRGQSIDDFKLDDFVLEGYDPFPAIPAPMAA